MTTMIINDTQMKELAELMAARRKELAERYQARREALMEACEMNGKQGMPNQSASGWHAPHDGWMSPETQEIYGKGQWVPLPRDDWYCSAPEEPYPEKKHRVLILTTQQQEFHALVRDFMSVSFGREWVAGHDHQAKWVRYAWLSGYEPMIRVVEEFLEKLRVQMMEEVKAQKGEAVVGKVTTKATILSMREQAGFGYGESVIKMLVELPNRSTAWGTAPRFVLDAKLSIGDEFEFTANFEAAKNDNTHSFFKRPRQ